MPQHVIVQEYNPLWPELFEKEEKLIREILGENCIAIHHIGSTAVPGLAAKPIIDIMPVVRSLDAVDEMADDFRKAGYEYLGEFGIEGRRYLRKGGDERTHQIHIFSEQYSREIERHLAVRDYLRAHAPACRVYGQLKMELARKYPYDIDGYCDGKDEFVQRMERAALKWQQSILAF